MCKPFNFFYINVLPYEQYIKAQNREGVVALSGNNRLDISNEIHNLNANITDTGKNFVSDYKVTSSIRWNKSGLLRAFLINNGLITEKYTYKFLKSSQSAYAKIIKIGQVVLILLPFQA